MERSRACSCSRPRKETRMAPVNQDPRRSSHRREVSLASVAFPFPSPLAHLLIPLRHPVSPSPTLAGRIWLLRACRRRPVDSSSGLWLDYLLRPNVDQTAAEEQKALAEIQRKIREHKEREIQELEEEAVKQYISHFSVDRQGNVKKDKDVVIDIPALKVQSNASPEINSEIANFIDGAVSASFNNKFDAMNEKFESMINSRFENIESKINKQFSGKDVNGSTFNTENCIDSALEDLSNLHIPKAPIGSPPINHIHSRTTIGTSAGGGSTMIATNAMTPHTAVYYEPSIGAYVSNSSPHHVPNALSNQTATYSTPQPTINRVPHSGSARPRTVPGMEGFREEMLEMFRQTFGIEPKTKNRSYQRPYPENYEYVAYPPGFKIPEFTKFSGDDDRSTLEHIV